MKEEYIRCLLVKPNELSKEIIIKNDLKSYSVVCLGVSIIVLSCVIFLLFSSSPPAVDTSAEAITQV